MKGPVRSAALSVLFGLMILVVKFVAYRITGSAALYSDAIESIVNVMAALFAMGALLFAHQPADREHPYGHGKAELLSATFEGGLIAFAAAWILYEAVMSAIRGPSLNHLETGIWINFAAGAANGVLGLYLIRAGRKAKSAALEADGQHVLSDFYTTLGVAAGLGITHFTGWLWLDPLLAAVIGIMLAITGFGLVRRSVGGLLDSQNEELIGTLIGAANRVRIPDIIAIHGLRTQGTEAYLHVDAHIVVPEFRPVSHAHDSVERFSMDWLEAANLKGEVHAHVDPCRRAYCARCHVVPCPIRKEKALEPHRFESDEAVSPEEEA